LAGKSKETNKEGFSFKKNSEEFVVDYFED